jgi:Lon protease-like protein
MFGVVNLDPDNRLGLAKREPPQGFATAGFIRSCQKNADGTSDLVLHGVARVKVEEVLRETPFRVVRVSPVVSEPGAPEPELVLQRREMLDQLRERGKLGCRYPDELASFLEDLHDHAAVSDLAAHLFCLCSETRQRLLETLSVSERLKLLGSYFGRELTTLRLKSHLGGASEEGLAKN